MLSIYEHMSHVTNTFLSVRNVTLFKTFCPHITLNQYLSTLDTLNILISRYSGQKVRGVAVPKLGQHGLRLLRLQPGGEGVRAAHRHRPARPGPLLLREGGQRADDILSVGSK